MPPSDPAPPTDPKDFPEANRAKDEFPLLQIFPEVYITIPLDVVRLST